MIYKIKDYREKKGLTQEELAAKSNVSRGTIALLETKPDFSTTTKTLLKIATALETTVDAIFFEDSVQ